MRTVRLINVVPSTLAAHDVVNFLPLHRLPFVVFTRENELVGTGAAFETVRAGVGGARNLVVPSATFREAVAEAARQSGRVYRKRVGALGAEQQHVGGWWCWIADEFLFATDELR